ncbi:Tat pathway signal sequence domain protein [Sphingomonas sp. HF-S4]|uniref:Tat pathway signal sequence domain protein n=1 Tax=Sphingomonas agrestis TaxID=3080540 RepID=A0ABU3Y9I2_9SPHN|nr:Tat pathway signal sequence domain protein [Sphingomonas sp. HF-S4]MDV3457919.1 Tat pathway signal sequence domain protein [Sphingomonas sp. HF-S4]
MRVTRRTMMAGTILSAAITGPALAQSRRGKPVEASIRWIDGTVPELHTGQTFGLAWARGALAKGQALTLRGAGGEVPAQSWPTAFWPDGSIKWTAHAVAAGQGSDGLVVAKGRPALPAAPVSVRETADAILIRSGALEWDVAKSGPAAIRSAKNGERTLLANARLLGEIRAGSPEGERIALTGTIERAVVEQKGPVRAVVRLEGTHQGGGRSVLPFVVRLYAYAGSEALRIVHSFVLDIEATDHISALGIATDVPMRGALHDRHIRLATAEDAMFAEAVRPLTGLRRDPGKAVREAQVAGKAVTAEMRDPVGKLLERIPAWSDFSLAQLSANGFTLTKRTGEGHGWIDGDEGRRAPGFGYVGSPQGGAGISARYFWQRHPTQLDILGAASDTASLTAWLWSPEARPMDVRPYHGTMGMESFAAQNEGLDITYEDYEPGWDDAKGIARTSELMLWAFDATPATPRLQALARAAATPPQLMADPAHLHAAGVFGDWGLPDRSTPARARIEDQLANLIDFYDGEVDRRSWYGFWDHGDVMHSYDSDRHQWKYDIGGFAWANSELSPDLWLWYAALRSGDARTWRLAEAMTRHTGEVDTYHMGRFKGLGTRHGVQHWSDSSKQPRVSNAAYRRIFYYLTADERVGDLMRALIDSEETLQHVEIGRKTGAPKEDLPEGVIQMAFGTTWAVCAGAWLTEWERTGERKWRDRIAAGMDSIGRMPNGWLTGGAPYDLKSGRFLVRDNIGISHLNAVFGAVEIQSELIALIDVPRFRTAWLDYCRWFNAPRDEWAAKFNRPYGGRNLKQGHSRLTAYVAKATGDAALAKRAAEEFYSGEAGQRMAADPRIKLPGGVVEWPGVSTNGASQWGLAAIQTLALIPEALDTVPVPTRAPRTDQANPEQGPTYRP